MQAHQDLGVGVRAGRAPAAAGHAAWRGRFRVALALITLAGMAAGSTAHGGPRRPPNRPPVKRAAPAPKSKSLSKLTGKVGMPAPKSAPKSAPKPPTSPKQPPPTGSKGGAKPKTPAKPKAPPKSPSLSALKKHQNGIRIDAHTTQYGPLTKGPLKESHASAFRSSTYTRHVLQKDTILYRQYGGQSGKMGDWWTRSPPKGSLQGKMEFALPRSNTAAEVVRIRVPKGTVIHEGIVAAHNGRIGGGNQVFLPKDKVNPNWVVP